MGPRRSWDSLCQSSSDTAGRSLSNRLEKGCLFARCVYSHVLQASSQNVDIFSEALSEDDRHTSPFLPPGVQTRHGATVLSNCFWSEVGLSDTKQPRSTKRHNRIAHRMVFEKGTFWSAAQEIKFGRAVLLSTVDGGVDLEENNEGPNGNSAVCKRYK